MLSLSTFGIPPMRLRRIKNHIQALAADDALLARENVGERLSVNELRDALEERGMYVLFLPSLRSVLGLTHAVLSCLQCHGGPLDGSPTRAPPVVARADRRRQRPGPHACPRHRAQRDRAARRRAGVGCHAAAR